MAASPSSGYKSVRQAIQSGSFDRVYYFHGAEDYLKDETVRHLVDAAVEPATRDFNLEILRGGDTTAEALGSSLATPPIMAARRVVVVRDVGALKKDARAMLDRYLDAPASDAVVVLTAPAGAKEDKQLARAASAVAFEPLTDKSVTRWIAHCVEHDLGATITPEAIALLQGAVGVDLAQLRIELDKLASFASGSSQTVIDESAVGAVVGVRRGETMGDLLDAVAERNAARALELVGVVLQQPKTNAVTVVMALTTQTLALAWGRGMRDRGTSTGRLAGAYYDFLKDGAGAMTGRAWGEATRAWVRTVDRWPGAALEDALEALLAADAALKETRLSSDEQMLTTLVLTLCGAPAARPSHRAA